MSETTHPTTASLSEPLIANLRWLMCCHCSWTFTQNLVCYLAKICLLVKQFYRGVFVLLERVAEANKGAVSNRSNSMDCSQYSCFWQLKLIVLCTPAGKRGADGGKILFHSVTNASWLCVCMGFLKVSQWSKTSTRCSESEPTFSCDLAACCTVCMMAPTGVFDWTQPTCEAGGWLLGKNCAVSPIILTR